MKYLIQEFLKGYVYLGHRLLMATVQLGHSFVEMLVHRWN